jgi:hypothetical protein
MPTNDVTPERFNGLMSSYQKALARIKALEAQMGQGGTEGSPGAPVSSQAPSGAGNAPSGAVPAPRQGQVPLADQMAENARKAAHARAAQLDAEDQALAQRVAQVRTEKAHNAALARWPDIAPLVDMLDFDGDQAAFMAAAEQLNSAIGGSAAESEPAPPQGPPDTAGNVPMYAPDVSERLDAIKARGRAGDSSAWSEYYHLKEEQAYRDAGPL